VIPAITMPPRTRDKEGKTKGFARFYAVRAAQAFQNYEFAWKK
jgi:hypothetical protein